MVIIHIFESKKSSREEDQQLQKRVLKMMNMRGIFHRFESVSSYDSEVREQERHSRVHN